MYSTSLIQSIKMMFPDVPPEEIQQELDAFAQKYPDRANDAGFLEHAKEVRMKNPMAQFAGQQPTMQEGMPTYTYPGATITGNVPSASPLTASAAPSTTVTDVSPPTSTTPMPQGRNTYQDSLSRYQGGDYTDPGRQKAMDEAKKQIANKGAWQGLELVGQGFKDYGAVLAGRAPQGNEAIYNRYMQQAKDIREQTVGEYDKSRERGFQDVERGRKLQQYGREDTEYQFDQQPIPEDLRKQYKIPASMSTIGQSKAWVDAIGKSQVGGEIEFGFNKKIADLKHKYDMELEGMKKGTEASEEYEKDLETTAKAEAEEIKKYNEMVLDIENAAATGSVKAMEAAAKKYGGPAGVTIEGEFFTRESKDVPRMYQQLMALVQQNKPSTPALDILRGRKKATKSSGPSQQEAQQELERRKKTKLGSSASGSF